MGWQTLSSSLRRWDIAGGSSSPGEPSLAEVEAAVEEVLADSNDEEALQIFTEALDPKLQRGSGFLRSLAQNEGAKCRCDAVWYGDTIAYGCKTCGLSSASCICVFCFDAGDHEGHDFYISRSDYGCCDCGDTYAWRKSGFCRHHPGPRKDVDPARLLPEATRRRARLLIPAQVKRLVRFQPNVFPASSETSGSSGAAMVDREMPNALGRDAATNAEGEESLVTNSSSASAPSETTQGIAASEQAVQGHRVLVTGVNLRVTEEQLRDFFAIRTSEASAVGQRPAIEAATRGGEAIAGHGLINSLEISSREPPIMRVELVRDPETKASKGRCYITFRDQAVVDAALQASGEILRGSPLRLHAGEQAIAIAERHLHAWETNFEWLLSLGGFHDGLRKIIGQVFLERELEDDQSPIEVLLRQSHLLEPSVRKLETNLMVDLMLDLDFKHRFSQVFTSLYRTLVLARAGNQDTNELGDFTCQIFTRQDVTLELVREHGLVRNLLGCLWDLLKPALVQDAMPIVFNHESNIFRDHEIIQCSMDLLYVLDHAEVAREIIRMPNLRGDLWEGWVRILIAMQAMNPHLRRSGMHVEFTSVAWGNALTLHTDLMSNTWLILDAVESKAALDAVQDMARWTWAELRAWMMHVHVAENRTGAETLLEYTISSQPVSFHVPVNRILALLLHHLCVRSAEVAGHAPGQTPSLQAALLAVGLTSEADVLWWMEHPLRALVLHSQVSAGMWRRNGEALENESEFYRMNYWHHLLVDMDLLVLRMAGMVINPENFFRTLLLRFENRRWLEPGDPLAWLSGGSVPQDDEFALQKLQSFVLLLHQLLSAHTPLSLNFQQMVMHTTRQYLSIGPRSHSQLWDPRLERSTATSTAKDQQMLEGALREISTFSEADGAGHSSAKYHLKANQWSLVDPYFHLFSWSEQQKSEENLMSALKARGETLPTWLSESAKLQPQPCEVYRSSFFKFCTCGLVQAVCWLLLVKLAFKYLKDNGTVADGRLLVLALHLALRSVQAPSEISSGNHEAGILADDLTEEDADADPVHLGDDEVQLFRLAAAMGPHLCSSARRRFCVSTASFFDAQLLAGNPAAPRETEICLLDALERLSSMPEENVAGGLARGLRARLLQDRHNFNVSRSRPRPWFAPAPEPSQGGADEGSAAGSRPSEPEGGLSHDEARRAKRRRAAQERQQRMLDDLKKRQTAFITGAQGQRMLEEAGEKGTGTSGAGEGGGAAECVVCISQQEGEDGDNPLGLLCFLRPAVASCLPRERVPVESAVLLQAPKSPVAEPQGNRGPQCFSPRAPDGLLLVRSCSHRMHYTCWRRFRPGAMASSGGRFTCPYCGTVANALLPVAAPGDNPALALDETEPVSTSESTDMDLTTAPTQASGDSFNLPVHRPMRHADASEDFVEQLSLHIQKLGTRHALLTDLSSALGFTGESAGRNFLALTQLCADNITLAEVRLRTRRHTPSSSSSASASTSVGSAAPASGDMQGNITTTVLRCVAAEALQGAPDASAQVAALTSDKLPILQATLAQATPHGRFQALTTLLIALTLNPESGCKRATSLTARSLLYAFYVAEAAFVLGALASDELCEQQLALSIRDASSVRAAFWQFICDQARGRTNFGEEENLGPAFTPVQSPAEASHVLKLALNAFLAKVHILLSLLSEGHKVPLDAAGRVGAAPTLAHEHQLLASSELGLPDVDSLLFHSSDAAASHAAEQLAAQLLKWVVYVIPRRGLQPSSPILLVLVADGAEATPLLEDEEPPPHVWQVTSESFERLIAVSGPHEALQLETPQGMRGRLYCIPYRLTLPAITGKVYQKFYTQFVHARCTVCNSSPAIPTICLSCGTFLCCNSECCRRRLDSGDLATGSGTAGEVTQHAQVCGFGTCVFLQLSNSLVHIVADGFIACWGSLYLDGHGEEEYNLGSPLHISEARLQQLTQSIREVSFDFESRLKWKKVIFV